jgi:hypothetical protein
MTLSEAWGLRIWKQPGDEGKPTGIDLNPGSTTGMDDSVVDEENWTCFVNSVFDKRTKTRTCFKRAQVDGVDKSKLFK